MGFHVWAEFYEPTRKRKRLSIASQSEERLNADEDHI